MKWAYKRWVCRFVAGLLFILTVCAGVVYAVDPAFYYRMPRDGRAVYVQERYQSAGMAKHVPADTILLGTSMTANYRAGHIGDVFGGSGLRITLPDGYLSEFDQIVDVLFRYQQPERLIFAMDLNIMIRDESGLTAALPGYLYNRTTLDDIRYLLNKDSLYYSIYSMMCRTTGQLETLDEGFTWDKKYVWWSHQATLMFYQRPEVATTTVHPDAYRENAAKNLAALTDWIRENPNVQFCIFWSPYSLLYWDQAERRGETEALLNAMEQICEELLEYDNVSLYGYLMDREFVEDLDNYNDHLHHSPEMGERLLAKLAADEGRLTKENLAAAIANWREFVVNYNYEKFWDDAFWIQWAADKAAGQAS